MKMKEKNIKSLSGWKNTFHRTTNNKKKRTKKWKTEIKRKTYRATKETSCWLLLSEWLVNGLTLLIISLSIPRALRTWIIQTATSECKHQLFAFWIFDHIFSVHDFYYRRGVGEGPRSGRFRSRGWSECRRIRSWSWLEVDDVTP